MCSHLLFLHSCAHVRIAFKQNNYHRNSQHNRQYIKIAVSSIHYYSFISMGNHFILSNSSIRERQRRQNL